MEEAVGEILAAALRCSQDLATIRDSGNPPLHLVLLFEHLAGNRVVYRGMMARTAARPSSPGCGSCWPRAGGSSSVAATRRAA
jgi:hypothetical protein